MYTNPVSQSKTYTMKEAQLDRLHDQVVQFEALLHKGLNEESLKAFDAETEVLLSEIFGNPSDIGEAYVYAQLGGAGAWINLQEEAQADGEQDVKRLSLQQRKGVLDQAIVELQGRPKTSVSSRPPAH